MVTKIKAKIKLENTFFIGWFTVDEIKYYEWINRVITIFSYSKA